jgi:phosphoglycerate kinase
MKMGFNKLTVRDIDIAGKPVFIRVDFNVPVEEGEVVDDSRIVSSLPTINYAREQKARIVLASHMGRPKGRVVPELSLKPAAVRLSSLLKLPVKMADDCIGEEVRKESSLLEPGEIILLENLRFHPGETANDPGFARELSSRSKIYINDAFGVAHRAHASTVGIVDYVEKAVAGFLLEKEVVTLKRILETPHRPFIALLGGAKVSTKIDVLLNLLERVDAVLIGGGMAFTFIKAKGGSVGSSLLEEDKVEVAREIIHRAEEKKTKLILPADTVAAKGDEIKVFNAYAIEDGYAGFDIGPNTISIFGEFISEAKTVLWNGPLGKFEDNRFDRGTKELAKTVAQVKLSVVGGGDTVSAVKKAGVENRITHISTGGGASLEFLAGKKLPAIEALNDKGDTQ